MELVVQYEILYVDKEKITYFNTKRLYMLKRTTDRSFR